MVIFHTFFTLISLKVNQLQIESENEEYPYIWFSMGIDHSNPYIHSTTVLCDNCNNDECIKSAEPSTRRKVKFPM